MTKNRRSAVLNHRGSRQKFQVRVREGEEKKSRFYTARSSGEARRCYKGNGVILSVRKVTKESLWGVGSFFTLGDSLMKELKKEREEAGKREVAEMSGKSNKIRGYDERTSEGSIEAAAEC